MPRFDLDNYVPVNDRITAFWYGQLVGNYIGFPFEGVFVASIPCPHCQEKKQLFTVWTGRKLRIEWPSFWQQFLLVERTIAQLLQE